jgi:hypothetical protein
MLISQKHRFVFFCMPKCASNSIETMLRPHSEIHLSGSPLVRHTNFRQFQAHLQPYLESVARLRELESICLVREPVSWLNSWYRFRARHQLRNARHPHSTARVNFEEFVRAYLSESRPAYADISTQFNFVCDAKGRVGVDRLFAYDDIAGVVQFFSRRVGRKLEIRKVNVSPARVYESDFMERIDALKRRVTNVISKNRSNAAVDRSGNALPASLYAELRSAIPKDFDLYESTTRCHTVAH